MIANTVKLAPRNCGTSPPSNIAIHHVLTCVVCVCFFTLHHFDTLILGYDAMFYFLRFLMPLLNFKTRDHVFCFAINVIYTISPVLYVYNPKFAPYVFLCVCVFFLYERTIFLCVCVYFAFQCEVAYLLLLKDTSFNIFFAVFAKE